MLEVREVFPEDFDRIHAELLMTLDPRVHRSRWKRLFRPPWRGDTDPVGVALHHGDRPVGFLALLFAPSRPGDARSRVCNLSSWVVLDEYRGSSLRLLAPVLSHPEWTVTNLTPTPEVGGVFQRLGFRELETHRCLLLLRPDRLLHMRGGVDVRSVDPSDPGGLDEVQRWIVEGHGGLARYLALASLETSGLLVYNVGRLRGLPTIRIRHVSDADLFRRGLGSIHRLMLRQHGACMMEFDRRLLGAGVPGGTIQRRRPVPRLFRSTDRRAEELTELFSETILLNL